MSKHVLILGAGVIGLSTAYYCARRGHRVTVVDRQPADGDNCSLGNAGMIVPSHFVPLAAPGMVALGLKWMWNPESPFYIKPRLDRELLDWGWKFWRAASPARVERAAPLLRDLHLASRACFEQLAQESGNDFDLVKKGLLLLCKTQHALDEETRTAHRARSMGLPAEVLDAKQTARLEPNVRLSIAGAVYFPRDCHLSPHKFMATLRTAIERLHGSFLWNTEVTACRHQRQRVEALITRRGDLTAEAYVLCTGAWSGRVARTLGLNLPLQAGKGYSLTLEQPRQRPEICAILHEARIAVTPLGRTLRVGGTMEMVGLNEEINPARIRGIVKAFPQYFSEFRESDFDGLKPWRGLRPCSPDGLPYLGRTARFDNLLIATGHSMMGLSLGPITGQLIAQILSDEAPSIPVHLLNPDRYA